MAPVAPETTRREREVTPGQTILQWIENLAKVGGFFAIFGYLSLITHFNTIGLSAEPLGIDRYMMELGELAGAIPLAIMLSVPLLAAGGLLFLIWRRFLPHPDSTALASWAGRKSAPWIMAALLMIVYWTLLKTDAFTGRFGIAVGDLSRGAAGRGSWILFFVLFYICAGALALSTSLRRLARKQESRNARWWLVPLGVTAMLALQLPLVYGRTFHSSAFPRVQVVRGVITATPICGLLLLQTTSSFYVWTVQNNAGLIEIVPRADVKRFAVGQSADLWDMVNEVAQKRAISLCPAI